MRYGKSRRKDRLSPHIRRLIKLGWFLASDGSWRKGSTTLVGPQACQQACHMENLAKQQENAKTQEKMIQYLLNKGWQKSEKQDAWLLPHWQKTPQQGESLAYVANLKRAYRTQLSIDSVNQVKSGQKVMDF